MSDQKLTSRTSPFSNFVRFEDDLSPPLFTDVRIESHVRSVTQNMLRFGRLRAKQFGQQGAEGGCKTHKLLRFVKIKTIWVRGLLVYADPPPPFAPGPRSSTLVDRTWPPSPIDQTSLMDDPLCISTVCINSGMYGCYCIPCYAAILARRLGESCAAGCCVGAVPLRAKLRFILGIQVFIYLIKILNNNNSTQ